MLVRALNSKPNGQNVSVVLFDNPIKLQRNHQYNSVSPHLHSMSGAQHEDR